MLTARLQPASLDRRAPPPAEAAGRQQVHRRRRFHRDDRRRPERSAPTTTGRKARSSSTSSKARWCCASRKTARVRDIPIKAGEMFYLPPRVPHSPQRMADSIGLVIERKRLPHEDDGLLWFCEQLQPQAVRGILPPAGHRDGFPRRCSSASTASREHPHLQGLRPPQPGAVASYECPRIPDGHRGRIRPCSRSTPTPTTCRATGRTWPRSTATTASR